MILKKMLDNHQGKPTKEYVSAIFKATRIIDGHSIENVGVGVLDFRIDHRFGALNTGISNFYGLDNATTKLALDYGITRWLMVGVGRSTLDKEYDGTIKVKLLRQTTNNSMPISLSYAADMSVISTKPTVTLAAGETYYFSNRLSYVHQVLIARKFNDWLSLQLMPTLVHINLIDSTKDNNNLYAIGVGGRVKLSKRIAVTGEYYYVANPLSNAHNALSFGIDIETGGHVFQLVLSNSNAMTERAFIASPNQNNGKWSAGDIHFGFNISRVFTIVRPKGLENTRNKVW